MSSWNVSQAADTTSVKSGEWQEELAQDELEFVRPNLYYFEEDPTNMVWVVLNVKNPLAVDVHQPNIKKTEEWEAW